MNDWCILCGKKAERAHWPIAKGMGGRREDNLPTVPLCREHHDKLHSRDPDTVFRVEDAACDYWCAAGVWEEARPHFDRYLSREQYRRETRERKWEGS